MKEGGNTMSREQLPEVTPSLGLIKARDRRGLENPLMEINGNWDVLDRAFANLQAKNTGRVNASELGLKGDGTDETAKLKAAIEYVADNHLVLVIPKTMTILMNYMIITGKSNFAIQCDGIIKRLDNSPTTASLIRFDGCSEMYIPNMNMDGNALNNGCIENTAYTVNQEQKHSLSFTNCYNTVIDRFYVNNPCGDGIYLSNGCKNFVIDKLLGKADKRIGRNIISFISAQDIFVNHIYSDGIGHYDMPGGLDIEPNGATEIVKNIFINNIDIRSGGSNPLSVLNTNGATVENVFIDKASIISDNVVSANPKCAILAGKNVTVNQLVMDGGGKADLLTFDTWDDASATSDNIMVRRCLGKNGNRGVQFGFNRRVTNIEVKAKFTNLLHDGVALFWCKGVKLDIDIDSVGASRFMVNASPSTGTVENVSITGDISKRGTGLKAIISNADPSKIINWTLDNLNFTGWGNDDRVYGGGLQGSVRKTNCVNLTMSTSIPSGSATQWKQGDVVWNIGTDNAVAFWRRLTNGTANVSGTDWKVY